MEVKLTNFSKHGIRSLGLNEYWLQDQIYANPAILGLSDNVQPLKREKQQSSGGKLDIMLFDQDQNSMYEVEVMLGDTDPSHIIRTLEYWDVERRRYPQRQHYAVLVAETITRRFYNVIQMLSMNFPMIAIQVEMIKVNNDYLLNFVKVLDVYEEMDIPEENVDEQYWGKNYDWILQEANKVKKALETGFPEIKANYVKSYMALMVKNRNVITFHKRNKPNFKLEVSIRQCEELVDSLQDYLNQHSVSFEYYDRYKVFSFGMNDKIYKASEKPLIEFVSKVLKGQIEDNSISED